MNKMSCSVATMGSRFDLIFDVDNKVVKHGSLGMYLEVASQLICGVKSEAGDSYIPFSDMENNFYAEYMSATQNSVIFKYINKNHGYNMNVTFTSPFIPKDEKLAVAPFFYVDIDLESSTRPHNLVKVKKNISEGTVVFGLKGDDLTLTPANNGLTVEYDVTTSSRFVLGDFARTLQLKLYNKDVEMESVRCYEKIMSVEGGKLDENNLFNVPFKFDENGKAHVSFVWATHNSDDITSIYHEHYKLLYNKYFKNVDEVCEYAIKNKAEIEKKSHFYDSVIENSSLSQNWKDFLAFTFQSYKLNTLHVIDKEGKTSFTVWEGNCMFDSTVDVEYNNGLFYYTMCDEYLDPTFYEWSLTEKDTGIIRHDLGRGYNMDGMEYPANMEIEEDTNFILMLFAYCRMKGDWTQLKKHYATIKKLAKFIYDADTTGNGIPNVGTSNSIDDSIPAIHLAKEQTYLAIKACCAFQAVAEMSKIMGDDESYAEKLLERAKLISDTVNKELWLGDHYGVCLDKSQDGYFKFLTREPLSGEMQGRNEYNIYAENGLLYLMMCGFKPQFVNLDRHKENIFNATQKCSTEYGCNHSECSDSVWISQNLWRDFNAAYLGHDFLDNVDKYWEFQKVMNTNGKLNLFIDTVGENSLWYYPRGLTSMGVLYAMLRLKINSIDKVIEIAPLRSSIRIPLVFFADWKNQKMPWVVENGGSVTIENSDLLEGYSIIYK